MKVQKAAPQHGPFHTLVTVIASLIALAGIGLGIWFFIFFRHYEETNDAQVEQYVTPIISRVTGYIKEVRYNENQMVRAGDTLLIIDDREYKTHLDMAMADIANAKENVVALQKDVISANSNVAIRQAQLNAANVQVWKTEQEYHRYTALLKEEAATEQQTEQVKAAYESAKAERDAILHTIQSTELNTNAVSAKIPAAQNIIHAKEAAEANAALYVSYTVITAPYDGWAGKRNLQPGQVIKDGQTLLSVVSHEKWVTANFKETQIGKMTVGQAVTFTADATGNKVFHGVIASFSPASGARFSMLPPDNSTGNFVKIEQRIPVRIQLTDADSLTSYLRAGMNVTVTAKHTR